MFRSHAVLIVADDANFARDLLARWQLERSLPGLTVMNTELMKMPADGSVDLAIVGPVRQGRLAAVLKALDTGDHPVICLAESAGQQHSLKSEYPRLLVVRQHETWLDTVILLATECLKRADFSTRLRKAEQVALAHARHAALGRYMLEARHDFNNSLTSVLGNAELLLMDESSLPALSRDQLRTIHEMALHMHAVMQRFSLIAAEAATNEKTSQDETSASSHISLALT